MRRTHQVNWKKREKKQRQKINGNTRKESETRKENKRKIKEKKRKEEKHHERVTLPVRGQRW